MDLRVTSIGTGGSPAGLDFIAMYQANAVCFPHVIEGRLLPDHVVLSFVPAPGTHDFHRQCLLRILPDGNARFGPMPSLPDE